MRVAGGHDAEHFGIVGFLVCHVLDAGTCGYRLGHARRVGVHAVRWYLPDGAVIASIIIISVGLLPDSAIDG